MLREGFVEVGLLESWWRLASLRLAVPFGFAQGRLANAPVLTQLFGAQCVHGFDAGGASCWDESCDRCEEGEHYDCTGQRQRVVGLYAIELCGHQMAA